MKPARPILIAALALSLAGCDDAGDYEKEPPAGFNRDGRRVLIGTDARVGGLRNDENYILWSVQRDKIASGSFAGYGCPGSCAGLKAGYAWAKRRGILKAAECDGPSWDYIEGCVAFTQQMKPETPA